MSGASQIEENMDFSFSDKTVGKVVHGPDRIKLAMQGSHKGEHPRFIPVSWIGHIDRHVHLNKIDVTARWAHEGRL
jgi:hypothetical protein